MAPLDAGQRMRVIVRGDCMRPLENGQSVLVSGKRVYWPGDLVLVRRQNYVDVHRLLGFAYGRTGWVVLTQADDAAKADPAAGSDALLGRADVSVSMRDRAQAVLRYARTLGERSWQHARAMARQR